MNDMDSKKIKPHLLLVEDNAADIFLLKEVVTDAGIELELNAVNNGYEAMAYLHRTPPFENVHMPDIVLLDLNMPGKNGFDVLAEIRQDAGLRHIPVIILSTSNADEDINRCYRLGANCFISKPSDYELFSEMIQGVMSFWLTAGSPE